LRYKARLKQLEKQAKHDKLEVWTKSGNKLLFDNSDLLSLTNQAFKFIGVQHKDGSIHYPAAVKMSDQLKSLYQVRRNQSELLDMLKDIIDEFKEATSENI
jgi:hypothetical protein